MKLGPQVPAWSALASSLLQLVEGTGAATAVVMDESNALWCCGSRVAGVEGEAFALLERALRAANKPLRRGGRVDTVHRVAAPFFAARSFAGIYVLIVWFESSFDAASVHAAISRALPTIEALTLLLPPPDGPGVDAGAKKMRA